MVLAASASLYGQAETFDVSFASAGWPNNAGYSATITSTAEFGGTTWKYSGLANNNGGWEYLRGGAKSTTKGDMYIASVNPVEYSVEQVDVNVTNFIRGTINSASLLVADNSDFTDAKSYALSGDLSAKGVWTATVDAPQADMYYKVLINFTNSTKSNGVIDIDKLTFTYTTAPAPDVATPTIELEEGDHCFYATMACETEGAEIHYTTDGVEPDATSTLYTAPVEVLAPTTIKAVAVKDGELSRVRTFAANPPLILGGFSALGDVELEAEVIVKGAMTAVFQNGQNLYVKDAAGKYMLVFGSKQTFENGDSFDRLSGKYTEFQSQPEITSPVFGEITTGGTPVLPVSVELEAVGANMMCQYVKIEGVEISGVNGKNAELKAGDVSLALYDKFSVENFADGVGCTVEGFVGMNKEVLQLLPTQITISQEVVPVPVFTPADGSVVSNGDRWSVSAEEGCTVWYKFAGSAAPFEEYDPDDIWSTMISGKIGEVISYEAYAEKDGVKSEVITVSYTIGKNDPKLRWVNPETYETVEEFIFVIGETSTDELPVVDGTQMSPVLTSSDTDVAIIDEDTRSISIVGPGTAVITVTTPETDTLMPGEASFTLVVEDPSKPKPLVESVIFVKDDAVNQSWAGYNKDNDFSTVWVSESGVEFSTTCVRGEGATGTSYATINTNDGLRVYGGTNKNEITVSAPANMSIVSLDFTVLNGNPVIDGTAVTVTDGSATYKFDNDDVVKFVLSAGDTYKQFIFSKVDITIMPIDTGVADIEAADENAPVEYYNLHGVRVANPEKGLYIRRQGNNVTKVIL